MPNLCQVVSCVRCLLVETAIARSRITMGSTNFERETATAVDLKDCAAVNTVVEAGPAAAI